MPSLLYLSSLDIVCAISICSTYVGSIFFLSKPLYWNNMTYKKLYILYIYNYMSLEIRIYIHETITIINVINISITSISFLPSYPSIYLYDPNTRSNYRTIALISHASKVMLKILQARLQQYVNCELPDVQAGFRKGRRTRYQIANIRWIIEKAREFQKKHLFLLYWLCQSLWLCGSQ